MMSGLEFLEKECEKKHERTSAREQMRKDAGKKGKNTVECESICVRE